MFFSLRRKTSNYFLHGKLSGHSGGIERLRATEDGRLLASGGSDGTKVWDLGAMRQLGSPGSPALRGGTTALVWIKRDDEVSEALFYGTENGYLVCWREAKQNGIAIFVELSSVHLANPAEITGLAFDAPTNRLAVCHRGGLLQVYVVANDMSLQNIFSIMLEEIAPRAVAFGPIWGNQRDLLVFSLYDGHIYTFRGNNGTAVGDWDIGGMIGDIAIDNRKNVLCIDEPSLGTNIYRLDDQACVKTLPVSAKKKEQKKTRQVGLLEECKFIVSGSDHGVVYVFNRRSGATVDELRVHPSEYVQTIATAECAGFSTIFAAKSRDLAGPNEIFVWRKKSKDGRSLANMVFGMFISLQLFFVAAAVVVVYRNFFTIRM
ncbi:WD40-repeat-containing domain protein [Mycena metata]|uniref:WD40-repeat-containing domain protein n=1 Tax=Mycena metata TaxID=1033252 RepID=A0AAD7H504_9AGAR|nr:WD40-repeat-containing domain protein [Mycena metata]